MYNTVQSHCPAVISYSAERITQLHCHEHRQPYLALITHLWQNYNKLYLLNLRVYVNFSFLLRTETETACSKSVCISLPDAGKSSDRGILVCGIGPCQILAFSDKTFWNVTSYSVIASCLFLIIEVVSSSMELSGRLWEVTDKKTYQSPKQDTFPRFSRAGEDP